MRPTSTPPCGAGLNAIRASTSTSPRPPGSTWSSACSPISPVVVCVGDAFAVSPNSKQRSDATLTTATPLPNRSFGPKGPTPSFENTNGLNGTLFRGRDTRACRGHDRNARDAQSVARADDGLALSEFLAAEGHLSRDCPRLCHARQQHRPPPAETGGPARG